MEAQKKEKRKKTPNQRKNPKKKNRGVASKDMETFFPGVYRHFRRGRQQHL